MQFMPDVQILVTSEDYLRFFRKYKLEGSMELRDLEKLWKDLRFTIRPTIWYAVEDARNKVYAAVTLGYAFDEYQEKLESAGRLLDAYASDCLGLEALLKMYDDLELELSRRQLFVQERIFGDPEKILQKLDTEIIYTEKGMMKPLKSAALELLTGKNMKTGCQESMCSSCENRYCLYREGQKHKTGASAMLMYSYGYQKIFGK